MTIRMYRLAAVLILVSLVELASAQNSLTISTPREESRVPQYGTTIRFNSNASIDSSLMPVVFIKDPIRQWWPWLSATGVDNHRVVWQLEDTQFGGDRDRGRAFQIQVLVIPQSAIDNGFTVGDRTIFIQAGSPLPNSTMVTVLRPRFSTKSSIVRVTRQ